jgi:hypothetical protein
MNVAMTRERLSPSLLLELFELEEESYRLSLREAKRLGSGEPAAMLRALSAHASESLDELLEVAKQRRVRLGSAGAIAKDTLRRVRDVVRTPLLDHEHAYRNALSALRRGTDLGRLLQAAASDEGDDALAAWTKRWVDARERLVDDAASQLAWFATHPLLARLPTPLLAT